MLFRSDLNLLQGKWVLVSSKFGINPERQVEGAFVVVRESVMEFHNREGAVTRNRIFLEQTKKHRKITLHGLGGTDPDEKPLAGLYRLAGDEFILCFGWESGSVASTHEGGVGMQRYVFKRAPKP